MLGAHSFAWAAADTTFLRPDVRGIFAGWLIATMVWMNAASNTGRLPIGGRAFVVGIPEWLHAADSAGQHHRRGGLVSALNHAQVVAGFEKGERPG